MSKARREDFDPKFFKGVAHRGLHNEQFTENGLNAFQNAIDHGLSFELDIHLTKDNELIVCHDPDLKRTTGKEGIIEHLTSKEIRENYRLLDGEVVPTLQEVLDLNKERELIVVELKPLEKNHKALAKKALEVLEQIQDKKKITLISFDPRALWPCKKSPFTRGLLLAKVRYDVAFFRNTVDYIDIEDVLVDEPKMKKYRQKGGIVNCWTIRTREQFEAVKEKVDTVTFELMDDQIIKDYYNK